MARLRYPWPVLAQRLNLWPIAEHHRQLMVALAVALATFASRLPFHSTLLNSHDAVQYALALHRLDVRIHQPHPPGYPLYVGLGRLFRLIVPDDLAALLSISILFSALGILALYLVGRRLFGHQASLIAALLAAVAPAFWHQGVIAAPYTLDFFVSTVLGGLIYAMCAATTKRRSTVWLAAITLGLAGAFRIQTLMILFPLFLYGLRGYSWRVLVTATVGAGLIAGLAYWVVALESGGLAAFVRLQQEIVPMSRSATDLAQSVDAGRYWRNLYLVLRYSWRFLGESVIPLTLAGLTWLLAGRDGRLGFLLLWLIPAWLLYVLVKPGNQGTILVCMPPLYLLAGTGASRLLAGPRWIRAAALIVIGLSFLWHIAVFTALPSFPFGMAYRRFDTYSGVAALDRHFAVRLALLRTLPSAGTAVFAQNWRIVQYYAPAYTVFSAPKLNQAQADQRLDRLFVVRDGVLEIRRGVNLDAVVPPKTVRVVLFDLTPELILAETEVVTSPAAPLHRLYVLEIPPNKQAQWTPSGMMLVSK